MYDVGGWISRNWTNVVSVSLSTLEIVGGVALTSTPVTVPIGIAMISHGGANIVTEAGKIVATTVVENKNGKIAADLLNNELPDSAIGMAAYFSFGKNEKAGAVGDIVDVGVGLFLGKCSATAEDAITDVANFATKNGIFGTVEQKMVTDLAKTSEAAIVANILIEAASSISTFVDNSKQFYGDKYE